MVNIWLMINIYIYPMTDPAGAGRKMLTSDWGILMGSMAHHYYSSTEKGSVMGIPEKG
jgi:hypothetical protein